VKNGTITFPDLASDKKFAEKGIKEIVMLGVDEKIKRERTSEGLVVNYPTTKPGDYAYTYKIIPNGELIDFDRE